MILDFQKRKNFIMGALMYKAGYTRHPNGKDYIKPDETGRFHIKYHDKRIWDLHYDINVDWKHFSPDLPFRNGQERKRLNILSYKLFPEEFRRMRKEKKQPETLADVLNKNKPIIKKIKIKQQPNKKLKPTYADPAVVKAELARIKAEREVINTPKTNNEFILTKWTSKIFNIFH